MVTQAPSSKDSTMLVKAVSYPGARETIGLSGIARLGTTRVSKGAKGVWSTDRVESRFEGRSRPSDGLSETGKKGLPRYERKFRKSNLEGLSVSSPAAYLITL